MVQLFTSATALKDAKRKHGTGMNLSPRMEAEAKVAAAEADLAAPAGMVSHEEFTAKKKVCRTGVAVTPRRGARAQAPPPREQWEFGHNHETMEGPPYHQSAREFALEKKEHMTPILASSGGRSQPPSPSSCSSGGSAVSSRCSSHEAFSDSKRLHQHGLDSCGGAGARGRSQSVVSFASCQSHCSSGRQYNEKKRLHLHEVDSCREGAAGAEKPGVRRRNSCLAIREGKPHHSVEIAKPGWAEEEAVERSVVDETSHTASNRAMAKSKRRHSYHVAKPVDEEAVVVRRSPHESHREFEIAKKYHEMDVNYGTSAKGAEEPAESPRWSQSRLESLKRTGHKATIENRVAPRAKPEHCVSNAEFAYGKARHWHEKDSCRSSRRSSTVSVVSTTASSQCRSNKQLAEDKRVCRHAWDVQQSPRRLSTATATATASSASSSSGAASSPRCSSHIEFEQKKRGHRHEIDACTPRRSAPAPEPETPKSGRCSSHREFTFRKSVCRQPVDQQA